MTILKFWTPEQVAKANLYWALWTMDRRRRPDAEPWVSYKLTYEPSAQVS